MKIVINVCYGGFSLSPRAVKRLAELQGKSCYLFSCTIDNTPRVPFDVGDGIPFVWQAFTVPNPDEVIGDQSNWLSLSLEERKAASRRGTAISLDNRPDNRTDPLLVQVVEELGNEADGSYASLKIVEIPDDVEWEISEYDGLETVEEKHRSWS